MGEYKKGSKTESCFFPKQLCFVSPALQTHTDVNPEKRESKSERGEKK